MPHGERERTRWEGKVDGHKGEINSKKERKKQMSKH
jgi:hypothetical protein